jgi:hypothetical protein
MSMKTVYVKLTGYHRQADKRADVEWRIEDSEGWPGKLEIAVYGWRSGEELSAATLEPHEVVMLLAGLETNTTVTVNVTNFVSRVQDPRIGRWYESTPIQVTMQTLPLLDREREVEVDGEKLTKMVPSGMGVRVWGHRDVVEEFTLRPLRLAEVVEALKAWLASVPANNPTGRA